MEPKILAAYLPRKFRLGPRRPVTPVPMVRGLPLFCQLYQSPNLGFANDFLRAAPHSMRALSSRRCLNGAALLRVTLLTRPMFECDGPERSESVIIFFSFELGHTRRPAAFFEE